MNPLASLARATNEARARTGNQTIGTQARAGLVQVVSVTYPPHLKGKSEVTPLSGWLTAPEAVEFLAALKA